MNKRVLKIVGLSVALLLLLGVGAVAGGGIVYALTRGEKPIRLVSAEPTEPEPGIVIAAVVPDGPAAEAGVARGDILLQVDGEAVDDPAELMRLLGAREPGGEVELTVLHGDDERTLTATLDDRDGRPYLGIVPCSGLPGPGKITSMRTAEPGAALTHVEPDSPADQAGLQAGDVIVAVDGQELSDEETSLADVITAYEPGDTVTLEVKRPGPEEETREVTVELGEHPEQEGVAYLGVRYRSFPLHRLEMEPKPFDFDFHFDFEKEGLPFTRPFQRHGVPEGQAKRGAIVWSVEEDSPAAAAGLRPGDLITAIEGEPVERPGDLSDAIGEHEPGDRVTLAVYRPGEEEGEEWEVEVTLAEHPEKEGEAYLGVRIGGFFMHHLEGGEWPQEGERFKPHLEFDLPFDELPPDHFEFHFPPEGLEGDDVNCCGEGV